MPFTEYINTLIDRYTNEKNASVLEKTIDIKERKNQILGLGGSPKKSKDPVELQDDPITINEKLWMSLRKANELRAKNRKEAESAELSAPSANYEAVGYGEGVTQRDIEDIIREESRARNIDPNVAVKLYRSEGLNSYQSKLKYKGKRERSYGPFQLFIDGGLGNEYQEATGGNLQKENDIVGITRQIRWSLDWAAKNGSWSPWRGIKKAGIEEFEGLNGAKAIGNWRE
jgi:hypothetical protein